MNHAKEPLAFPIRINKYIAKQGIASRREADELITAKKVHINGDIATIGQLVHDGDRVDIGKLSKKRQYLAYYKGRGIITHSPEHGETDIATKLAQDYNITDVAPVGRLDKDSEGLIILTNDGRITAPLLDPEYGHEKEYDVLVDKPISGMFLRAMAAGVDIEGYRTKPAITHKHPKNDKRFSITITEGKKHQIRRMCAALGYQIQSLKRIRVANIGLDKLKPNQYRKIHGTELQTLLHSLRVE